MAIFNKIIYFVTHITFFFKSKDLFLNLPFFFWWDWGFLYIIKLNFIKLLYIGFVYYMFLIYSI